MFKKLYRLARGRDCLPLLPSRPGEKTHTLFYTQRYLGKTVTAQDHITLSPDLPLERKTTFQGRIKGNHTPGKLSQLSFLEGKISRSDWTSLKTLKEATSPLSVRSWSQNLDLHANELPEQIRRSHSAGEFLLICGRRENVHSPSSDLGASCMQRRKAVRMWLWMTERKHRKQLTHHREQCGPESLMSGPESLMSIMRNGASVGNS